MTIFGARRGERRYNRRTTGDLAVRLLLGSKLLPKQILRLLVDDC